MRSQFLKCALLSAVVVAGSAGAQNVQVSPNPSSYPTLKAAFDAINAGAHTGAVQIEILQDTVENTTAVLNASGAGAASFTSVTMVPVGARTVAGNPGNGQPLVDLNGADNVTINGINHDGNTLAFSNLSRSDAVGTSTIRLRGDIRSADLSNLRIFSEATVPMGNAGGALVISDALGEGVDSVRIDGNLIGSSQSDSNLTQGFFCTGATNSVAAGNAALTVSRNRFANIFSSHADSTAIQIGNGCHGLAITDNEIYQSRIQHFGSPRIAPTHFGIRIHTTSVAVAPNTIYLHRNTIGGSGPNSSADMRLVDGNGKFVGIFIDSGPDQLTESRDNLVGRIERLNADSSGVGLAAPFAGLLVTRSYHGSFNDRFGPFVFETNRAGAADVVGMGLYGSGDLLAFNPWLYDIKSRSPSGQTQLRLYGIQCVQAPGAMSELNLSFARVGGVLSDSLVVESTSPLGGQVSGVYSECARSLVTNSTIAGLDAPGQAGDGALAAVLGLYVRSQASGLASIRNNLVSHLRSSGLSGPATVQGIMVDNSATASINSVSLNAIYRLQADAPNAMLQGLRIKSSSSTFVYGNSVKLGENWDGAPIRAGMAMGGIRLEGTGSASVLHNSVLLTGEGVTGSEATRAIELLAPIQALMQNNVIANQRSNDTGTGEHVAVWFVDGYSNQHDYNLYDASGVGGVLIRSSTGTVNQDFNDLASWQLLVGGGTHNVSDEPGFMLNNVLHLRADSVARNIALTPIGLSGSDAFDIDDHPRPGTDGLADLGADEHVPGVEPGSLSVSRSSIDFGTVITGEYSPVQSLVLANDAPAIAEGITVQYDIDFQNGITFGGGTTCSPGSSLAPGESCVIGLVMQSETAGSVQSSLRISSDRGETAFVSLTGEVVAPTLRAGTESPVFARVFTTVAASLRLDNLGVPDYWQIDAINNLFTPFSLIGNGTCGPLPVQLGPMQGCTLDLQFAPNTAGSANSFAFLRGRAGFHGGLPWVSPVIIQAVGTTNTLGALPTVLNFGNVEVGASAEPLTAYLGNGDSVARSVAVVTPVQAPFLDAAGTTCTALPGVLVAAHASCVQRVGFSPVGPGVFEQTLTVQSSDGDVMTVVLRGTGVSAGVLHADGFE